MRACHLGDHFLEAGRLRVFRNLKASLFEIVLNLIESRLVQLGGHLLLECQWTATTFKTTIDLLFRPRQHERKMINFS